MDWFDLLKQPKLRAGSKITTNLSNIETDEQPCLKKIKEYCAKLGSPRRVTPEDFMTRYRNNEGYITERVSSATPTNEVDIPEDVACKALKELQKASFTSLKNYESYFRGNVVKYNGYEIVIEYYSMPRHTAKGILFKFNLYIYGEEYGEVIVGEHGVYLHKTIKVVPYSNSGFSSETITEIQEQYMKEVDWR